LNILFDNVNFNSTSGPNSFATRLSEELTRRSNNVFGISDVSSKNMPDIQLSFIMSQNKIAPLVQRLDGIYFNIEQDYSDLNKPIQETYENSEAVIFQTDFNKTLTEKYFGNHWKSYVIRNGTDVDMINSISPIDNQLLDKFDKIWCCASSWRPHKRLSENVRYFLESASDTHCLIILGSNPDFKIKHPRVFYGGHLEWNELISVYKRAEYFIHLSWLDHCPNVVADARASGCKIICSSSGGTREIAGKDAIIIDEERWDFSPIKLYRPPKMDFSNKIKNNYDIDISIRRAADQYMEVFKEVLNQ
jgi:glycosyltransferase involved in cell wall biosynthesis